MKAQQRADVRRVVIYARVSTVDQDLSLPEQVERLRKFCTERQYEVANVYEEKGATGTDDQRPKFRSMMSYLSDPSSDIQGIVVVHTSRFMRDSELALFWKRDLEKRGIRLISPGMDLGDDPMSTVTFTVLAAFDQYESEMIGVRTRAGLLQNARQGWFNGSRPPYGFSRQRIVIDASVEPAKAKIKLATNSEEAVIVELMFTLYVGGMGAKQVAEELNRRGLRYRKGSAWTRDLVLRILCDRSAIGTFEWARGTPDCVPIPVEPLIATDLFDLAQQLREERDPSVTPGRVSASPALLAGLIRCGKCGAAYSLESSGKKTSSGNYDYRYYNCRTFLRSGKSTCSGHRHSQDDLDRAVLDHVAREIFSPARCKELLRELVEEAGVLRTKAVERRLREEHELEDVQRKIRVWEDAFERGDMPKDLGTEKLRELTQRRTELREALSLPLPTVPSRERLYGEEAIARFQASLQQMLLEEDQKVAKTYIRLLVARIVVDGRRIQVVARGDAVYRLWVTDTEKKATGGRVKADSLTPVVGKLRKPSHSRTLSG